MSTTKRVAMGAVWLFGVQVLTGIVQLGYAAFTARHADQVAFGQYAIALSATALVSMVANAGLGASASRMHSTGETEVRALLSLALLTGVGMALVLVLAAQPWAHLWGNSDAAPAIRLLALGVAVTPATGVQAGVLRREGRFRDFFVIALFSSTVGMAIGILFVVRSHSAASLVMMSVASSWLLLVGGLVALRRRSLPMARLRGSGAHAAFGAKAFIGSFIIYLGWSAPSIALTRRLSVATFGEWNRGLVIGTIPLEMLTRAIQNSIYPEFRNAAEDPQRMRRVWTDMMSIAALIVWPAVGCGVVFVPPLTLLILGPKWEVSGGMAQWMLVGTALTLVSAILGAALESAGLFRPLWGGSVAWASIMGLSAVIVLRTGLWQAFAVGSVLAAGIGLVVQVAFTAPTKFLDVRRLCRHLGVSIAAAAALLIATIIIADHVDSRFVQIILCILILGTYYGLVTWRVEDLPIKMTMRRLNARR